MDKGLKTYLEGELPSNAICLRQAVEFTGLSKWAIYRSDVKKWKIGKLVYFDKGELLEYARRLGPALGTPKPIAAIHENGKQTFSSIREAARYFGVSVPTMHKYVGRGHWESRGIKFEKL